MARHRHGQRQVHLGGAHTGLQAERPPIGLLRLLVAPLQVAGDADIVPGLGVVRRDLQDVLEQSLGGQRVGGKAQAAQTHQHAGIIRRHLLRALETGLGVGTLAKGGQRFALANPRRQILRLALHRVGADPQRHRRRAAGQGGLGDRQAGRPVRQTLALRPRAGREQHDEQDGYGPHFANPEKITATVP